MSNFLQDAPILMAGLAFYVTVYHMLLYFRLGKVYRYHLSFSFLCLAIGIYAISCAGLYNATNLAEGMRWQQYQYVIEQFFAISFIWFLLDFLSYKKKYLFYPLIGFFVFNAILAPFDQAGLILNTSMAAIKVIQFSPDLEIIYYEYASGPLKNLTGIIYIVLFAFLLKIAIAYYKYGHQKEARPLLISLVAFFGAVFNDVAVVSGLYRGIYIVEYAYVVIVIFMTFTFSSGIVDSVMVQRALKATKAEYSTLVEKMSEGLIIIDGKAKVTYVNDKFCELLCYPREQIVGKQFLEFLNPTNQEIFQKNFALRREGKSDQYELQWSGNQGKKIDTLISPTALFDERGNFNGSFGIITDITKKKAVEETLKRLYEDAIEISEMKTNLITYATHELKTPLVPILGWSEFIKSALERGESIQDLIDKKEIDSIFNSAQRLTKIIENFLDIGRLESNRLELRKKPTHITSLVENAIKNISFQAKTANISIQNGVQDTIINCDPFRMEQVFINILSNAIKYSPPETKISCNSELTEDLVIFHFLDQGFGFTPEELQQIWRPFSKSFPQRKGRTLPSTGVGLYLSKGIVEMHGGTIDISSDGIDKGSCVNIRLPRLVQEEII